MDYWKAADVPALIDKYRKHHPSLVGAKFACIFREKAAKSDGEPIVGKAKKVTDKYKPIMEEDYDYIMEIGADVWQELSGAEREAWVDHLLGHCYGEEDESTGEMKWKTRRPEIIAFTDVLDRHGVDWDENLQQLKEVDLDPGVSSSSVGSNSSGTESQSEEESSSDSSPQEDADEEFEDMMSGLT